MLKRIAKAALKAPYVCRGCGYETSYQGTFKKCPVCGIKWS